MMVFVDGENLTMSYQRMVAAGRKPQPHILHYRDVYVWNPSGIQPDWNQVVRAFYYTYFVGDEIEFNNTKSAISNLKSGQLSSPYVNALSERLGQNFRSIVFKKDRRAAKAKGVDIQMVVDILSNTYANNLDVVYLISGDGDFVPVLEEAVRHGKKTYVASLSNGLNSKICSVADRFINLDEQYFEPEQV